MSIGFLSDNVPGRKSGAKKGHWKMPTRDWKFDEKGGGTKKAYDKKKHKSGGSSKGSGSGSGGKGSTGNEDYDAAMQQSLQNMKVPPEQFPIHVDHQKGDIAKYGGTENSSFLKVTIATVSGVYPLVPRTYSHKIPDDSEEKLIADLISVQVQNDMQNDIPTATFTLGAKHDWSSVFAVNDLVRIDVMTPSYVKPLPKDKKGQPVSAQRLCIYTGLISNLVRNLSYSGGQETYTVTAQGMAKIFSNIQLSTFSELQANMNGYQLLPDDEKTGIGFKQHTSANIIKQIINRFILQNQGGTNTYDYLAVQNGEDITERATPVDIGKVNDLMGQPMTEEQYEQYMDAIQTSSSDDSSDSDSDSDNAQQQAQQQGDSNLPEESWLNIPLAVDAGGELPLQNLIEFYIYENLDESYPDAGPNNPFVNYNGSILQMIKDVSSKPFNEMYWTHDRGVATFNYRPTPFDPENWKGLVIQEFAPDVITDINIGTNDQDQAAVYKLTPTEGLGNTQYDGGFNGNLAPLTNLELVHRYGYKLMQAQTDYFNGNDTESAEAQQTAGVSNADSEAMKGYTDAVAQMKYPPYTSIVDAFYYTSGRKGNGDISVPKEAGGLTAYNQVASAIKSSSNAGEFARSVSGLGISQEEANTLWTERNGFSRTRYLQVMMPNYNPTSTNISKHSTYLRSYNRMKAHPKKAASELIQELGYTLGPKQAYDLVQNALANGGKPTEAAYNNVINNEKITDQEDGVTGSPMSGQGSVPFFFLRYTEKLFDWYADNAKFYSGTLTIDYPEWATSPEYIGQRIEFYDDESKCYWEFYCEGQTYSYSYQTGLQVTLNLTRGVPLDNETDYGKRFNENDEHWGFWGLYTQFKGGYFGEQDLATAISNASGGGGDSGGSGGSAGGIAGVALKLVGYFSYSQGARTDFAKDGNWKDISSVDDVKKDGHVDCTSFAWLCARIAGYEAGGNSWPWTTGSMRGNPDSAGLKEVSANDAKAGDFAVSPEHCAVLVGDYKGGDTDCCDDGYADVKHQNLATCMTGAGGWQSCKYFRATTKRSDKK